MTTVTAQVPLDKGGTSWNRFNARPHFVRDTAQMRAIGGRWLMPLEYSGNRTYLHIGQSYSVSESTTYRNIRPPPRDKKALPTSGLRSIVPKCEPSRHVGRRTRTAFVQRTAITDTLYGLAKTSWQAHRL